MSDGPPRPPKGEKPDDSIVFLISGKDVPSRHWDRVAKLMRYEAFHPVSIYTPPEVLVNFVRQAHCVVACWGFLKVDQRPGLEAVAITAEFHDVWHFGLHNGRPRAVPNSSPQRSMYAYKRGACIIDLGAFRRRGKDLALMVPCVCGHDTAERVHHLFWCSECGRRATLLSR